MRKKTNESELIKPENGELFDRVVSILEQARFNTWFSSESYVLTSVQRPRAQIVERAKLHGVGLWSFPEGAHLEPIVGAQEHPLPQSFASWVFNERAWKVSLGV